MGFVGLQGANIFFGTGGDGFDHDFVHEDRVLLTIFERREVGIIEFFLVAHFQFCPELLDLFVDVVLDLADELIGPSERHLV